MDGWMGGRVDGSIVTEITSSLYGVGGEKRVWERMFFFFSWLKKETADHVSLPAVDYVSQSHVTCHS